MANWSNEQVRALKALGIPLFEMGSTATETPSTDVNAETTPSEPVQKQPANTATQDVKRTFYQVGVWTLSFPVEVPVPRFQWLEDLSRAFDTRPTQVSSPEHNSVVDCTAYAKSALSPDEKRALWAQLKPLLQP
ncbi:MULTISPECIES: hypothetical protein [Gammaproteobacteria]|uniref:hypothetical protein n=1 Tax=Gammaproteobacteria TaxID=1236 RepID=UPI000DD04709|nr:MULTISPECIES: hypothetical protein [Gammaproteobacteria]RTE86840.1 hypothetical protein DQX04_00140 [Aliidiomarina sp. B3213]TCZ93371.1 hypothetical protein EYQ95_05160 [Lysobacter sp. N42]